jgi:hypothetical protein
MTVILLECILANTDHDRELSAHLKNIANHLLIGIILIYHDAFSQIIFITGLVRSRPQKNTFCKLELLRTTSNIDDCVVLLTDKKKTCCTRRPHLLMVRITKSLSMQLTWDTQRVQLCTTCFGERSFTSFHYHRA